MVALTLAALLNAPVAAPARIRPAVIPVIGVMLGATMTIEVFALLGDWLVTFALLLPFLACAGLVSLAVYRKVGGYDPVTAFYASMPGGLNEMLIIGGAAGGDERKIALGHAARVLVVVTFVGLFFGLVLGVRTVGTGARPWVGFDALSLTDALLLLGCAAVGVPLGRLLRLPAPGVLGPMALSAAVHMTGLVTVAPPTLLVNGAQIVLGTVIGCRFLGSRAREVLHDLWVGTLSSLAMLAVAVVFAVIAASLTNTDVTQVFLAYSPGGLTEMSLLALAMGQEVAFVTVMHILRILIVILAAPFAFRLLRSKRL